MEQKLFEKFKESFVERLIGGSILVAISGYLFALSLHTLTMKDEWTFGMLGFSILFLIVSLLGLIEMLLRYAHDYKVLKEKKYEIYEGVLAYFDMTDDGCEPSSKHYVPVMTELRTGRKISLDPDEHIENDRIYRIYYLSKTKIWVAEKKLEEK